MKTEIPPTAGLPPLWRDLLPASAHLAQKLSSLFQLPTPQLECSGTAALVVTLRALMQHSDRREVIIPAYTCPLVALAISHCGLSMRLCDLASGHFDFNAEHLVQLVNDNTLAIVPTHLGGRVADVTTTLKIAQAAGAHVIEDAAQALGATYRGQSVGMLGDAGFFSLAAGKGLSIYEGGVLVTQHDELRNQLHNTHAQIVSHSWSWELRRSVELLGYTALYRPKGLYYAYGQPLRSALKQGDLVSAVGDDFDADIPLHTLGKWRNGVGARAAVRLPEFLRQSRAQALERCQRLKTAGIEVITDRADEQGAWPFLMLLMPDQASRDRVLQQLWQSSLGMSRLFIHALPDYAYLKGIAPAAEVPNARDFASRMLTVSNSPWLDDALFDRILSVLKQ